jgi:hypothetical protein
VGLGAVIEVSACGLLVFRRARPLVCATLAMLLMLSIPWFGPQLNEESVPLLVLALSIFSLARWVPDLRGGLLGVAVIAAAVLADYAFVD